MTRTRKTRMHTPMRRNVSTPPRTSRDRSAIQHCHGPATTEAKHRVRLRPDAHSLKGREKGNLWIISLRKCVGGRGACAWPSRSPAEGRAARRHRGRWSACCPPRVRPPWLPRPQLVRCGRRWGPRRAARRRRWLWCSPVVVPVAVAGGHRWSSVFVGRRWSTSVGVPTMSVVGGRSWVFRQSLLSVVKWSSVGRGPSSFGRVLSSAVVARRSVVVYQASLVGQRPSVSRPSAIVGGHH